MTPIIGADLKANLVKDLPAAQVAGNTISTDAFLHLFTLPYFYFRLHSASRRNVGGKLATYCVTPEAYMLASVRFAGFLFD